MIKSVTIALIIVLLITIQVYGQTVLIDPIGTKYLNQPLTYLPSSIAPTKKSFGGIYRVNLNSTPSTINIVFGDANTLSFRTLNNEISCTNASYTLWSNDLVQFTNFVQIDSACLTNDAPIVVAMKSAYSFVNVNIGQMVFYDANGVMIMIMTPASGGKQVNFQGNYMANIPNIPKTIVSFTSWNNVLILNGCNVQQGTYSARAEGGTIFSDFLSTKLFICQNDFDTQYVKALRDTLFFKFNGSQLILRNVYQEITVNLTKIAPIKLIPLPNGDYTTNLIGNSKIVIQVTNSSISILNGCNRQFASYKAYSNGTLSVSLFASTRMFCPTNFDIIYVNAFTLSKSFAQNVSQIILKNANGGTTVILTPLIALPSVLKASSLTINGSVVLSVDATNNN